MKTRLLLLLFLAGCKDKDALALMEKTAPVIEAAQRDLARIPALLPAQPQPLACSAPLHVNVGFLDERELHRIVDDAKLDHTDRERDFTLTFNPISRFAQIPSRKELAELRDDPSYAEAHHLFSSYVQYQTLENERYAVVYRTLESDEGKVEDDQMVRDARWKGWAFLVDVRGGELLAAAPVDARSDDQAQYFAIDRPVRRALDSCAIEMHF